MILNTFATKLGMTQAWTKAGKRLAITIVSLDEMVVIGKQETPVLDKNSQTRETFPCTILEIGYGEKKLKNMKKPLRSKIKKSGFSLGYKKIVGVRVVDDNYKPATQTDYNVGDTISADQVLSVGDVVSVQGVSKGRGFAGAMKRWNFHGGPATHGQSDRARAVGSIGAGTTPGRVWKGKKMPGHYGAKSKSVTGIVVLHIDKDKKEIWLSGPIPGSIMNQVKISKSGKTQNIELNYDASNIVVKTETPKEVNQESAE